jgi:hypothetical protein
VKTTRTPEELEQLADEIQEVARMLQEIAGQMREAGVTSIAIHGRIQFNRNVPSLVEWSFKVAGRWHVQSPTLQRGGKKRKG